MILIPFLFVIIKSDCINYEHYTFNRTMACQSLGNCVIISNSFFLNINEPILNCQLNSISIKDCSFTRVSAIVINTSNLNSFFFERNCCNNNKELSSKYGFIDISPKSNFNFYWNTFSGFLTTGKSDFISFECPSIQITNLNLSNNEGFNVLTSILRPTTILRFNDATIYNNANINCHIRLAGPTGPYSIDRINDNGQSSVFLEVKNNANFIITRVHMPYNMDIIVGNGTVWLVDSYMPNNKYQNIFIAPPAPGSIVVDSLNSHSETYFINHLSALGCPTHILNTLPPPPHTIAKSMKLKIAFSVVGGALLGVVVFLIIFFTIKCSIKCYQKKQDRQHPVFDL